MLLPFSRWPLAEIRSVVVLVFVLGMWLPVRTVAAPVVTVTGGTLRGASLPDGGEVFRGIPFAAPPVGSFRWRPPQPVVPWSGVRDALKPGPAPIQENYGWNDSVVRNSSEDCLYLDVWAPSRSPKLRPVMVWIHGGANTALLGGGEPVYEGRHFVEHGVVLVVIEYRLGLLGFLAHPELTRESPHHSSGNYALLDQIAALRWVQDNIIRFGGDPHNVTIFGQSAGGWDIVSLMSSPLTLGLFRRAIVQSGVPPESLYHSLTDVEKEGIAVARRLAVPDGAAGLAQLRRTPVAKLLKAGPDFNRFSIDGWVLPESPIRAWRRGEAHPLPLIIGGNGSEFPAQGGLPELRAAMKAWFGALAPAAWRLYGIAGDREPPVDPVYGDIRDQWGSDLSFRIPGIILGEWHHVAGQHVWEYEFDRAIAPHPRVQHSSELAYVFGNFLPRGGMVSGQFDATDRRLSEVMLTYWTNFAKTGNPNGPGAPEWPEFDPAGRRFMRFTQAGDTMADRNERGRLVDLFRRRLEQLADSGQ